MNLLLPGMYVAADSPLHRLDPRVKMGAALGLMVLPFAMRGMSALVLLAALVAALAAAARAPLVPLLRTLGTVFWLAVIMFVFYLFTTPGQPVVEAGGLSVTVEGLAAGGTQVYRLCLLVIIAALLTYTTSPSQLAHGLEALLKPLVKVGLPVHDLTLVLTIALRFVPTFFEEIETIRRAQAARGAQLQSGGPARRIVGLVPIFVPIFVSALRRSEELATAMEARGLGSSPHPTRLHRLHLGRSDLLAALGMAAAVGAILAAERWL